MEIAVIVCLLSFVMLVAMLRQKRTSLGLPIAYLGSLLLIHVPGAIAHIFDSNHILLGSDFTEVGITFTAIGTACFVFGVWLAHGRAVPVVPQPTTRAQFWNFCLYAGILAATIGFLIKVASFVALFRNSGPIWMLGVMLGLRSAMRRRDIAGAWWWLGVLASYPLLMLLLGGFLSYGSTAVIIVLSGIAITAKSGWRVAISTVFLVFVGISVFLGYFQNRTLIRAAVWGQQNADARIEAAANAMSDVAWFDPTDPRHLQAFDQRLNQNFFVGLAAARLESGKVEYLKGRSLAEGFASMIPRALWPDKPMKGGSGTIVSEMTGLVLSTTTSFGVGNVMEFHINFGVPGIVVGFFVLGLAIGWLDRKAAAADARGDLGMIFIYYLPAIALIQPNGSLVEIMGGATAGFLGGWGWKWAWSRWPKPRLRPRLMPGERSSDAVGNVAGASS